MSETKAPKSTANLDLSARERLVLYLQLRQFKIDSKETEWAYADTMRQLAFEDDVKIQSVEGTDKSSITVTRGRKAPCTERTLRFVVNLPYGYDGATAEIMRPIRDKAQKALDSLSG